MPRSDRATWWMRFAILFALCELWAIGAPLFSGPDEPSHVIKAASVVRGELLPDRVDGTRYRFVDVPQRLDSGNAAASCTAFHPEQDASCIDYRATTTRSRRRHSSVDTRRCRTRCWGCRRS